MVKTSGLKILAGLGITGGVLWALSGRKDEKPKTPKISVDIGPAEDIKVVRAPKLPTPKTKILVQDPYNRQWYEGMTANNPKYVSMLQTGELLNVTDRTWKYA